MPTSRILGHITWLSLVYVMLTSFTMQFYVTNATQVKFELAIPPSLVTTIHYHKDKRCTCRNMCFLSPNCTAVTIHPDGDGGYDCHLSDNHGPRSLFLPNSTAVTILKKEPECVSPFFNGGEFGCLSIFSPGLTTSGGRIECQKANSDLLVVNESRIPALYELFVAPPLNIRFGHLLLGIEDGKWLNGVPFSGSNEQYCGALFVNASLREVWCGKRGWYVCQY